MCVCVNILFLTEKEKYEKLQKQTAAKGDAKRFNF